MDRNALRLHPEVVRKGAAPDRRERGSRPPAWIGRRFAGRRFAWNVLPSAASGPGPPRRRVAASRPRRSVAARPRAPHPHHDSLPGPPWRGLRRRGLRKSRIADRAGAHGLPGAACEGRRPARQPAMKCKLGKADGRSGAWPPSNQRQTDARPSIPRSRSSPTISGCSPSACPSTRASSSPTRARWSWAGGKRAAVQAAFIQLMGQEGVSEARVSEIAPGASTKPLKLAMDELVYVLQGRGLTTVWAQEGERAHVRVAPAQHVRPAAQLLARVPQHAGQPGRAPAALQLPADGHVGDPRPQLLLRQPLRSAGPALPRGRTASTRWQSCRRTTTAPSGATAWASGRATSSPTCRPGTSSTTTRGAARAAPA